MWGIKEMWRERPLVVIVFLGFFFRLVAAFLSKGFGFADEHFMIIEAAQSWIDHIDYDNWLPAANGLYREPGCGHNFFYPGIVFGLFRLLQGIGITDPQLKMTVLRLLQVPYSMLTVVYGYKIAERLSNKHIARHVGIVLALLWILPNISVRTLIEVMCTPPLVIATWLVIKDESNRMGKYILVGVLLGIAFCFRFQAILYAGGFGLVFLWQRKWLQAFAAGFGFLLVATLVEGGVDMLIWHKPFVEFKDYITYNAAHAYNFVVLPWYTYVLFLSGVLLPPVSLFIFYGFFKNIKQNLILFLPTLLFIVFHSAFPNKRERFILPAIPFIVVLGYTNWLLYAAKSHFWINRATLMRVILIFAWVINCLALVLFTTAYNKRQVVEAMTYINRRGDAQALLMEDNPNDDNTQIPHFYLGNWIKLYDINSKIPIDTAISHYNTLAADKHPNYVLFFGARQLDKRLEGVRRHFVISFLTEVKPSLLDYIFYILNPRHNDNETTYIYKIEKEIL